MTGCMSVGDCMMGLEEAGLGLHEDALHPKHVALHWAWEVHANGHAANSHAML